MNKVEQFTMRCSKQVNEVCRSLDLPENYTHAVKMTLIGTVGLSTLIVVGTLTYILVKLAMFILVAAIVLFAIAMITDNL